jgi:hypothetical protein
MLSRLVCMLLISMWSWRYKKQIRAGIKLHYFCSYFETLILLNFDFTGLWLVSRTKSLHCSLLSSEILCMWIILILSSRASVRDWESRSKGPCGKLTHCGRKEEFLFKWQTQDKDSHSDKTTNNSIEECQCRSSKYDNGLWEPTKLSIFCQRAQLVEHGTLNFRFVSLKPFFPSA